MDSGSKKLRQTQNIQLSDTIITISKSSQNFAIGCLDDSITIWQNKFNPFSKAPILSYSNSITGLTDIIFSQNGKKMITCSIDAIIKIWDLQTQQIEQINVPVMSAWKLIYIDQNLVTCGDLGHIQFYDLNTKQVCKKLQGGDIFFTSIAKCNGDTRLAVGNNNGDLYIANFQKKDKVKLIGFKPHYKMIRSLSFSQDTSKIISGSDDCTIKIFDITSQKVISSYDGHKQSVSCVRAHHSDNKIVFSCSYDKSIKIWDLRMKSCIDTYQSGSALWAVECIGKNLVAGGENGVLSVFSIQ